MGIETLFLFIGGLLGANTSFVLAMITVISFVGAWFFAESKKYKKVSKTHRVIFLSLVLVGLTSLFTDAFMRGYSNDNTETTYECIDSNKYEQRFGVDISFDKNVSIVVKHQNSIHGYSGKHDEIFIVTSDDCDSIAVKLKMR